MYVNSQHKVSISRTISSMTRTNEQRLNLQNKLAIPNRGIIQKIATLEYKDLDNHDLIFSEGKIAFTEYKGHELKSPRFSGCIMAAFKFLRIPNEASDDIRLINCNNINTNDDYIAHVYASQKEDDQKYEFIRLQNIGVIKIKVMYKPYLEQRDLLDLQKKTKKRELSDGSYLTGSMTLGILGWKAKTYYSNNKSNKSFSASKLKKETYKTYGILGLNIDVPQKYKDSYEKGLNIFRQNRRITPVPADVSPAPADVSPAGH